MMLLRAFERRCAVRHDEVLRSKYPMHDQSFRILEFEALRTLVTRNAQTDRGRKRLMRLAPFMGLPRPLAECFLRRTARDLYILAARPADPVAARRLQRVHTL